MYLRDLWTSCVRRWYLVLTVVILAAAVLSFAAVSVKPTYESTASLVLVPPPNPETPKLNRYLDLGGLNDAVAVLSSSMTSDELQKQFAADVAGGKYEVGADATTSAPIVLVTAKADSRAGAKKLLEVVLARIPTNLSDLQSALSIKDNAQISAVKVSEDPPKRVEKTRLRILGALAVALLCFSALFVGLVDGMLLRRKQAKAERAAADDDEGDGSGDDGGRSPVVAFERGAAKGGAKKAEPAARTASSRRRAPAKRAKRQAPTKSPRSGVGSR